MEDKELRSPEKKFKKIWNEMNDDDHDTSNSNNEMNNRSVHSKPARAEERNGETKREAGRKEKKRKLKGLVLLLWLRLGYARREYWAQQW